jgi:hypothetical protein
MRLVLAVVLIATVWVPTLHAQLCGDASGDGRVTVSDGVDVLRAGAGLSTSCTTTICDVDGNGAISVTDGVLVLRTAAELPAALSCAIDARQLCLGAIRSGNLTAAAVACGASAAADPNDATTAAMAEASAGVAEALTDPTLAAALMPFGLVRLGSPVDVCRTLVRSFRPATDGPSLGAIVATLRDRGLDLIDRVLASVDDVPTDAAFAFSCPELAKEGIVADVDYGDLLVARYELEFVAALIHVAAAYDVDFDVDAAVNGHARFRDVFLGHPALFTVDGGRGAAELGLARERLDASLASFIAAVDFVGAETDDQSDDLFVIGPGDAAVVARERAGAVRMRAALNGTARFEASTFDLPSDQRLTLDRFLDGRIASLRPFVPGFGPNGQPSGCGIDDGTFGGILPDLEVDELTRCIDPADVDFVGGRFGPFLPVRK